MIVNEKKLQPEEIIHKSNEIIDKVYIILNGEIELYIDKGKEKAHLKYLKSGDVLYEKNYICENLSEYSSRATK